MGQSIEPEVIKNLCPELRAIVDAELMLGNVITETSRTWGLGGGTVWLLRRFSAHLTGPGVDYSRLADPHDGYAQFLSQAHGQVLICGLGT